VLPSGGSAKSRQHVSSVTGDASCACMYSHHNMLTFFLLDPQAMGSVLSAILSFGPAIWSTYVTNAITGVSRDGASSAVESECRTRITVGNASSRRRIEMDVQRL